MTQTMVSFNGTWRFRKATSRTRKPESIPDWRPAPMPNGLESRVESWMEAQVPGCVHTDLMSNRIIPDPFKGRNEFELEWIDHQDWEYRREFSIDAELLAMPTIELVCEGLDTVAIVSINGNEVARTENMFIGHRFDVGKMLKEGTNEIAVYFENPYAYIAERKPLHNYEDGASFGGSNIRKQHSSFGWDWAPSLASMGIFRSIRLEGRTGGRIDRIGISQRHREGSVDLELKPEIVPARNDADIRYTLSFDDQVLTSSREVNLRIQDPHLWWPNGQGDQPLYELKAELLEKGAVVDTWTKRIGLRTIVLDRHPDEWGESFQFVVNGQPVYAKGANWASPHSFPSKVDRGWYDDLLTSAQEANMNMIRVWGGGVYEQESFYDLCDEKGILVWQDFMFSCTLYPAHEQFIQAITNEAGFQTKRLSHHACMALWCGNNEIVYFKQHIVKTKERTDNFNRIFFSILPSIVERNSPQIFYWPGSPHSSKGWENGADSETDGDAHFYWNAWDTPWENHAGTAGHYRFSSEFGMQSFASLQTMAGALEPQDRNVASPAFEAHEKLPGMHLNLVKAMGHRFFAAKDFPSTIYQSQINQAYYVTTAIEHQRRDKPRSMGSLYWSLNDCWPVTSWSSIEFGGRWKALHWAVRRSFAPVMVSGKIINKEILGNHGRKTIVPLRAELHVVSDRPDPCQALLNWSIYCRDRIQDGGSKSVRLEANGSGQLHAVDLASVSALNRNDLVMRIWLESEGIAISEKTLLFVEPRQMTFAKARPDITIGAIADNKVTLTLSCPSLVYQAAVSFGDHRFSASDNFFDLFPGISRTVEVSFPPSVDVNAALKALTVMSYCDSY